MIDECERNLKETAVTYLSFNPTSVQSRIFQIHGLRTTAGPLKNSKASATMFRVKVFYLRTNKHVIFMKKSLYSYNF
jgi:hypothetical protein